MKKTYLYVFFTIIFMGTSCHRSSKLDNQKSNETPFNSILEEEIKQFISYINQKKKGEKNGLEKHYCMYFFKEDDNCFLQLFTDYYYDKNRVNGYTFVNDELIIFYGDTTFCSSAFIDTGKLIQYKDTIPNCKDYSFIDMKYESQIRKFKVLNNNKLEIIYTGHPR